MTRAEMEKWGINWGAWWYFGILTFVDRPSLFCCGEEMYLDGKRQRL